MSTLREDIIRVAHANQGVVQKALLTVLAADDEAGEDEKQAVTIRKKRRGPGVAQKQRKDRLRKKKDRRNTSVKRREKRNKKLRKNKPQMFKNVGKFASLREATIHVAFENPGVVQEALLKVLATDE